MNPDFKEEVAALVNKKMNVLGNRTPVVFYGSSSFRLWESLEKDFPELDCLNIAFGGSTIKDCTEYYDHLLKKSKPEKIFFYCGDNDIGQGTSAEDTIKRFTILFKKVREDFPDIPFIFLSIKPSPSRQELLSEIRTVNENIKLYLSDKVNTGFVNIYDDMLVEGNADASLFIEDQLHMNKKGYKIWTKAIRTYLGQDIIEVK